MSVQGKSNAIPIGSWQQHAGKRLIEDLGATKDSEASCQEVPIRVLGRRAACDSIGEFQNRESFEEDSTTMLLFPRGAVIRLAAPVVSGQDLMLINKRTNRYVHCHVTSLRATQDVNYAEIEFTHSMSDFWGTSTTGDAVRAASVVAAFAARISAEPLALASVESPDVAPARTMAAAAGAGSAIAGATAPAPMSDSAVTVITSHPSAPDETDERSSSPAFFAPRPMACIPVSEPVMEPSDGPPIVGMDATPAPLSLNWEAVSVPAPRGNRKRLPVLLAAAMGAMFLGYRFYSPAEAALPMDPQIAVSPAGGRSETASVSLNPASDPNRTEPPGAMVVTAPEPEMETVDAPKQRVVLVSSMTLPAKPAAKHADDAPELTSTATEQTPSVAPGRGQGLLGMTTPPLPPPPQEESPEKQEKAAEPLTPARLVSSVRPSYPPAARQAQIQGSVMIEIKIDASGTVTESKILSGPQALRAAAMAAVARWKYQPALLGGQPTASTSTVMITFQLR